MDTELGVCNSSLGSVWSCNINWRGVAERFERAEADFPVWSQTSGRGCSRKRRESPFDRRRPHLIKRNGCNNINSKSDIPACAADIFIPPLCQTAARVAVTLFTPERQHLSSSCRLGNTDSKRIVRFSSRPAPGGARRRPGVQQKRPTRNAHNPVTGHDPKGPSCRERRGSPH